ncbi:hypothetical protein BSA145_08785 [Bacillus safensis]|uniref:Uncharacterized protein n=1 Tax=Bacillus safensis TaxID=561879 RepID=A0A1L6ZHI9_BACIA|nr:hypothetical protein BSA145_08785 [Bacillus safensis]
MLELVQNIPGKDKAKCGLDAIKLWMQMQKNPPESVVQSRLDKIMNEKSSLVRGFICGTGHEFWVMWSWPTPPLSCPLCGDKNIRRTWTGSVERDI